MKCENTSAGFLKKALIDSAVLLILVCGIFLLDQLPSFQRGFFCGDESLMYPYRNDTVTTNMLYATGIMVPLVVILVTEYLHLRNESDDVCVFGIRIPVWVRGFYGSLVTFLIGLCCMETAGNVVKKTIGRLRPHFFDLCKPSIDCSAPEWQGRYILPSEYSCTAGTPSLLADMRRSFLSGHSAWASYTMVFAAMYIHRRRIASCYGLRHGVQFLVLLMGLFTAVSRVSDYKHHWSDVVAGLTMGTTIAVLVMNWCITLIPKKAPVEATTQLDEIATK